MNEATGCGGERKKKKKRRHRVSCCFGGGSDSDVQEQFDKISLSDNKSVKSGTISNTGDARNNSTIEGVSDQEQKLAVEIFEVDVSHLVNTEFDEQKGADSHLPLTKSDTEVKTSVESSGEPSVDTDIPALTRSESNQAQPSGSSESQSSDACSPKSKWEQDIDHVLDKARTNPAEADFGNMMELVSHRLQGNMDPAFRREVHNVLGHVGKIMSNGPIRRNAHTNPRQRERSQTVLHLPQQPHLQRRKLSLHEVQFEVKSDSVEGVLSNSVTERFLDEVVVESSETFDLSGSDALENENASASVGFDDFLGSGSSDAQRMIWLNRRSLHSRQGRWIKLAEAAE